MTSPYAPIRYRTTEWWLLGKDLAKYGRTDPNLASFPNEFTKRVAHYMEKNLCEAFKVFRHELNGENCFKRFAVRQREIESWIWFAHHYETKGRQVFDLGEDISDVFMHIDVTNCSLDQWMSPMDVFFLKFSGKLNASINNYRRRIHDVDGVFVRIVDRDKPKEKEIQFGFVVMMCPQ